MIYKLLIILDELLVYKFKQELVKNFRVYVADVDPKSITTMQNNDKNC